MLGKRKERDLDEEQEISISKAPKLNPDNQTLPTRIIIQFLNEQNKSEYENLVLTWLRSDFDKKKKVALEELEKLKTEYLRKNDLDLDDGFEIPEEALAINSFWHNRETISRAFNNYQAMVFLNEQQEAIGPMIWDDITDCRANIIIVEVKEDYRRQGIFKKMLTELGNEFTDIHVLSASVLQKAEKVYCQLGWKNTSHFANKNKEYYQIIKDGLSPVSELPNGQVIAICPVDYYEVKNNSDKYRHMMQYFQINLDEDRKSQQPILMEFIPNSYENSPNNYVGVYFNKELIAEGKAKHIFEYQAFDSINNLLIINRILPINLALFNEKGFFNQYQQQAKFKTFPVSVFNQNSAVYSPSFFARRQQQITTEGVQTHEECEAVFSKKESDGECLSP